MYECDLCECMCVNVRETNSEIKILYQKWSWTYLLHDISYNSKFFRTINFPFFAKLTDCENNGHACNMWAFLVNTKILSQKLNIVKTRNVRAILIDSWWYYKIEYFIKLFLKRMCELKGLLQVRQSWAVSTTLFFNILL